MLAAGMTCAASPAWAQSADGRGPLATYLVSLTEAPGVGELHAERGKPLAELTLRPERSVVLRGSLDPESAQRIAVHRNFPFVEGRRLFGWRDHPGLFCDLMRNRGLGSSAACLRDNDGDGKFDEAVRLDFNSGGADVVFITDKQKVRGGRFNRRQPLQAKVDYAMDEAGDVPSANVRLSWNSDFGKRNGSGQPVMLEVTLTDGSNFTGTEIFADHLFRIPFEGSPVSVDMYGVRLTVLGFDERGGLRYRLAQIDERAPVGLVFRGYTLRIITY